ncbi:MAG: hypothetical protein ACREAB_10075 [Blastocatellia bacterium]
MNHIVSTRLIHLRLCLLAVTCFSFETEPARAQAPSKFWTPFHEINPPTWRQLGQPERWGYGMMWWVWDAPVWPGGVSGSPFQGAYSAKGAGGQFITVLPRYDLVIAHKVNIDNDPSQEVTALEYEAILLMLLSCTHTEAR